MLTELKGIAATCFNVLLNSMMSRRGWQNFTSALSDASPSVFHSCIFLISPVSPGGNTKVVLLHTVAQRCSRLNCASSRLNVGYLMRCA